MNKIKKMILSKYTYVPHDSPPPKNRISHQHKHFTREIREIMRGVKRRGIIVALTKIPVYLSSKFNRLMRLYEKVVALRGYEFDRKNSIDTAGIVYQTDLRMNNQNQLHATYYQGSDSLPFNNALSSLKINFSEYTFIDFGSGKGKALLLASAYSFKRIIGIEFSENLHAIAQENIRQLTKDNIEAYCMDVVKYEIPDESIVCYFFDPFDEYIMTKVINNIRKVYTLYKRNIVIVYCNYRFFYLFDAEEWLERLNHIGPALIWCSKK